MTANVFDTLEKRGYVSQVTHREEIYELLTKPGVSFYIGFDPTADSLHAGSFIQMMVMGHMQRAGHRPIALMGGGTGMVGDPTGRTDLRKMMMPETIQNNVDCIGRQMEKIVDFSDGKAVLVNNADWLLNLNYVDFIRDIGPHFSVNRMLTFDCYKNRMEKGLSFLEFNYMLMQSYDFLHLYREYGCVLQLGGDDQWSNILGGVELIRRKEKGEAFGLTFSLLTNSDGQKMGKTAKGALWLDPQKTPPFDFYQYWRNTDDADVIKFLKLLTFLPLEEIQEYAGLTDAAINEAKKRLAYEVTSIIHGKSTADSVKKQAEDLFEKGGNSTDMPSTPIEQSHLEVCPMLVDILLEAGLTSSKGEARRLIAQKGIYLNDNVIEDTDYTLSLSDFPKGEAMVRKGKKVYHKLVLKQDSTR